uniref:Uncharacterized protein MANES_02G102900 n=1 Tax=Rhizophora mucronata TaxID=61149 RepID=A0A2P2K0C2_RHIMU
MKPLGKPNRVSWAPGVNLCQVRMFLTEDCPSKICKQIERRPLCMLQHPNGMELSEFPPGFEDCHNLNPSKANLPSVRRIKWKCPPKSVISCNWHVAAGEQSQEAETQQLREMRVLEAVYPRLSVIPANPSVSPEIEGEICDDRLTPIIPLTPIEEVQAADIPSDQSTNILISSQPAAFSHSQLPSESLDPSIHDTPALKQLMAERPLPGKLPDPGTDLITAASAAVTAIMCSREQESLIDTELLVKIFNDPKMIQKLMNNNQASNFATGVLIPPSEPAVRSVQDPPSEMQSTSKPEMRLKSLFFPKPTMLVAPMPANEGSQHLSSGEVLPVATRLTGQPPAFGLMRSAPSISIPTPEPIKVSAPRPTIEILYSQPCHVQTSLSSIPDPPNAFPNCSFRAVRPDPLSNLMPPLSGMLTQPNTLTQTCSGAVRTNPVKDVNYIKNLIREHGMEKPEVQDRSMSINSNHPSFTQSLESLQNIKMREVKNKFQMSCIYFKSSRGCRNGSNCPFQHDSSFEPQTGSTLGAPGAKRMKLSTEITG